MTTIAGRTLALLAVALLPLAACNPADDHGESTQANDVIEGYYWYFDFARAATTTHSPDLESRVGLAKADGSGTLDYVVNVGSTLPAKSREYVVNLEHQINNTSGEPGATLPGGEFFEFGDLDRKAGTNVGVSFFTSVGASLTINDFVDGASSGFYHAMLLQFNRPGVVTGSGNATVTKNNNTDATWQIDYTLSSSTTLTRRGSFRLAPDGAVSVQDTTTGRTYAGFGEPNGDWLMWMELDSSTGRVFRMDVLVRKAKNLTKAALNGRYNLVGLYHSVVSETSNTVFGRMRFDGDGVYFDVTTRDSFGQTGTTGNRQLAYDVRSDGMVTLVGGAAGFVTRDPQRRWLIVPDLTPSGGLGFFLALRK